jgi:hypothetical protein
MNRTDIRKNNLILIINAIKEKSKSLDELSEELKISKVTAINLTKMLVEKNIIAVDTVLENKTGRPTNYYRIENKCHTMFFEQTNKSFRCISIDLCGRVVDRFDFVIIPRLSMQANVEILYKRFKSKHDFGKYCIDVFASCSNELIKYLTKTTKIMSKEEIILTCLSEKDKAILFKLGNKYSMSLYSHIQIPQKGIGEKILHKAIKFDKIYKFSHELYDGIFLALEKHSLKQLDKLI